MYHVRCSCGHEMAVTVGQAGSAIECPACGTASRCPPLSRLRTDAGSGRNALDDVDLEPVGDPWDRLDHASQSPEWFAAGKCHHCRAEKPAVAVPVRLERRSVVRAVGKPSWGRRVATFSRGRDALRHPRDNLLTFLLLCPECFEDYSFGHWKWLPRDLALVTAIVAACFGFMAWHGELTNVPLLAVFAFGAGLLVTVPFLRRRRTTDWVGSIPTIHAVERVERIRFRVWEPVMLPSADRTLDVAYLASAPSGRWPRISVEVQGDVSDVSWFDVGGGGDGSGDGGDE